MPNISQAKLDETIANAVAAGVATALKKEQAKRNDDSGALWLTTPKPDGTVPKYVMNGNVTAHCPHCDTSTKYLHFAYATGSDGSQKGKTGHPLPLYRTSLLVPKDKS